MSRWSWRLWRLLWVIVLFVVVFWISLQPRRYRASDYPPPEFATPKLELAALPEVEVSVIESGSGGGAEFLVIEGGSWFKKYHAVHAAFLIGHPKATFLFDTGLGRLTTEQAKAKPAWWRLFFPFKQYSTTVDELARDGLAVRDIAFLIPSHLHWDHAASLPDFPDAEVRITRSEWDYGRTVARPLWHGIFPELARWPDLRWTFLEFAEKPYENFSKSLDLFGDGTIVLVPLPRHTPGHVGMFVNLRSGKRLFFVGDAVWYGEGIRRPAQRPWLASLLVGEDREPTWHTLVKLHQLHVAKPEIQIIPTHDRAAMAGLAHFPDRTR